MRKEVVLYRTFSGGVRACEPYCAHIGAHLGHGGMVGGRFGMSFPSLCLR
jgi:phenylpropionate dioxygenase-like ring-hydroxylating dioxygenase large terminal subunit